MKLYALTKVTYFVKNPLIDTYHFTMFHGWATRGDNVNQDVSYVLGDKLALPLKLYLNTFRVNDIIQPRMNLLVRAEAIEEIGKQRNLELLKCLTEGVCQIRYEEGDFSHWDLPGYADDGEQPRRILLDAVRRPRPGERPTYFEVICPNLDRIPGASRARKGSASFPNIHEDLEFPAAKAVFEEFPLVWHDGYFLISEPLFQNIRSTINWNYFAYTTVVIN